MTKTATETKISLGEIWETGLPDDPYTIYKSTLTCGECGEITETFAHDRSGLEWATEVTAQCRSCETYHEVAV